MKMRNGWYQCFDIETAGMISEWKEFWLFGYRLWISKVKITKCRAR